MKSLLFYFYRSTCNKYYFVSTEVPVCGEAWYPHNVSSLDNLFVGQVKNPGSRNFIFAGGHKKDIATLHLFRVNHFLIISVMQEHNSLSYSL